MHLETHESNIGITTYYLSIHDCAPWVIRSDCGFVVCVVCLFFFLLFGAAIATNNMRLPMVGDGGVFWKVEKWSL